MPNVSRLIQLRTALANVMPSVEFLRKQLPPRCLHLLGHGKPYFEVNADKTAWVSREGIKLSAEAVNEYCKAKARIFDEIESQYNKTTEKVEALNKLLGE